jgi:hypothetical protein
MKKANVERASQVLREVEVLPRRSSGPLGAREFAALDAGNQRGRLAPQMATLSGAGQALDFEPAMGYTWDIQWR